MGEPRRRPEPVRGVGKMTKVERIFTICILVLLVIAEVVLFVMGKSPFVKILVACVLTAVGAFGVLVNSLWKTKKEK